MPFSFLPKIIKLHQFPNWSCLHLKKIFKHAHLFIIQWNIILEKNGLLDRCPAHLVLLNEVEIFSIRPQSILKITTFFLWPKTHRVYKNHINFTDEKCKLKNLWKFPPRGPEIWSWNLVFITITCRGHSLHLPSS